MLHNNATKIFFGVTLNEYCYMLTDRWAKTTAGRHTQRVIWKIQTCCIILHHIKKIKKQWTR